MDRPAEVELHLAARELVDDVTGVGQGAGESVELRDGQQLVLPPDAWPPLRLIPSSSTASSVRAPRPAVKHLQLSAAIAVDGEVGPATRRALGLE